MLWLYRILYLPALVLGAPYYLWRMRKRGGYRENFSQRFGRVAGLPPKRPGVKRIWLQAVSVGEILAIGPLLAAWQREGGTEVYLTTTTSTGYRLARERYFAVTIGIGYFPLDWWWFSARAWRVVRPDLAILTEGERWPEHIHQAAARTVPVVCINARLSDRSFRRMARWRWAVPSLLGDISRLLACSEQDAERFQMLGFPAERITTTGNIKLDVSIPVLPEGKRLCLRRELGLPAVGLVIVGSSTWEGEEAALVTAWQAARAAGHACALLLVPRHAERRDAIELLLRSRGVGFHFRSRGTAMETVDVTVGDTTGELRDFLQLADVVFVGKSLPPHTEGQTPVESALLGRPVLFGPGMGNFRLIADELTACGAAQVVADGDVLATAITNLLGDAARRAVMAAAGRRWHQTNAGAVARTLAALKAVSG